MSDYEEYVRTITEGGAVIDSLNVPEDAKATARALLPILKTVNWWELDEGDGIYTTHIVVESKDNTMTVVEVEHYILSDGMCFVETSERKK